MKHICVVHEKGMSNTHQTQTHIFVQNYTHHFAGSARSVGSAFSEPESPRSPDCVNPRQEPDSPHFVYTQVHFLSIRMLHSYWAGAQTQHTPFTRAHTCIPYLHTMQQVHFLSIRMLHSYCARRPQTVLRRTTLPQTHHTSLFYTQEPSSPRMVVRQSGSADAAVAQLEWTGRV
jgi:hypothetical protein